MGRITRKKKVANSENIPVESGSNKKPSDQLNSPIVSANSRRKRMALSDKTNAVAEKDGFSPPITRTKGCNLKDRKATYTDENVFSSPKKPLAPSSDKNVIHLKAKDVKEKANSKRKAASEKCKENVLLPAKRAKTRNQAKVDLKEKSLEIKANAESESKDEVTSKTKDPVVIRPNIRTKTVANSTSEKEAQFNQDLEDISSPVDKLSSQDDNDEFLKAHENDCKTSHKGSEAAIIPRTSSRTQLRRQRKSKYDSDEWVTQKSNHKSRQSEEKIEINDNVPCDSSEKKLKTPTRKSPKSGQSSNKVPALPSHSYADELSESAQSHSERPTRVLKKGFLQRIAEKMGERVIGDESKDSAGTKPSCSSDLPLEKPSALKKNLRTGKQPSKGKEIKSKVVSDSKQGAGRRKCVKTTPSKMCPVSTKSPLTPHPLPPTNLFSLFKKPDTPRRLSSENKIFVSACEGKTEPISKGKPVYAGTKMTPIRRKTRAEQEIDGLYEFEVDENEPKPTKKPRRIMKIQRMRATKKKKRKEFVVDPEMEMKVLRTLELSPSVLNVQKPTEQSNRLPPRTGEDPPEQEHDDDWNGGPSSDVESCDEREQFKNPPRIGINSSTPYTPRYSASPAHFQLDTSTHSALNVSAIEYRVAPSSAYSPVKSKDSPIPVFLANERDDRQKRSAECDKQLVVSNVSAVSRSSGYSVYHNELDIGASTPVRRFNDSTTFVEKNDIPDVELNVSNCFGFDEPEIMEEPLVSPIKSTIRAPIRQGIYRPAAILKKKLPVVPPPSESASINVKDVIKQLRCEVGEATLNNESANASVFVDFAASPIIRSPLKKFLQSKGCDQSTSAMETTTLEDVTAVARKPRFSYERPKLRKRPIIWDKTDSEASATESDESSDEEEAPKKVPTRNRKVKPSSPKKKKGMTKKEEEELEKWAKMFNSQCEQVDNYGLCVE